MRYRLSERLAALKRLAGRGNTAADIGCDHGFLSIALIESGAYQKVIACDLREGPLLAAGEHIAEAGCGDKIECRLADGLSGLKVKEADTVICAGMGGALMQKILTEGEACARSARLLVLQPQSELKEFRYWLRTNGYTITDEDMVLEDGKFYPMMSVTPGVTDPASEAREREPADAYGPILLKKRHPVLKKYLETALKQNSQIQKQLQGQSSAQPEKEKRQKARRREVEEEAERIKKALSLWSDESV